jgi:hypothetical protein
MAGNNCKRRGNAKPLDIYRRCRLVKKTCGQRHCRKTLQAVQKQNYYTGPLANNPEDIRRADILAAMLTYIDAFEHPAKDVAGWYGAEKITDKQGQNY